MKIIYFHGFAGSPDETSSKVTLLKSLGHDVYLVDTQGKYSPSSYLTAFEKVLKQNKIHISDSFVLVGISLGGFWARFLGYQLHAPWIALNPPLKPSLELNRFLGDNVVFDTGIHFTWSKNQSEEYLTFENTIKDFLEIPGLTIFSSDDEVLPHSEYVNTLVQKSKVIELKSGGHRLQNTDDYKKYIEAFINHLLV